MITIDNKIYLDPQESALLLGISMPTLWRWIKSEILKKYSLSPKKIYLMKEELENLLK